MTVFTEILRFDLRYQLRSPLFWAAASLFALMAFGVTTGVVNIDGPVGNVHRNAPSVIIAFFVLISAIGLFPVTAFIAHPLLRDVEMGTDEQFFTTPVRKRDYLFGRFAAGLLVSLSVFAFAAIGMISGEMVPGFGQSQLGSFSLTPYLWAIGVLVIPNLLFAGAVLALLAVTTRKLLYVFIGATGFLVLWLISSQLAGDTEYRVLAAVLDPFGAQATSFAMRYLSAQERNTQIPALAGHLLINRLLLLSAAIAVLFAIHARFESMLAKTRRRKSKAAVETAPAPPHSALPRYAGCFDIRTACIQFLQQLRLDAGSVFGSLPFLVLLAFGLLNLTTELMAVENPMGAKSYPATSLMLEAIESDYGFLLLLIVGFYASALVWRERDARLNSLNDALPVPSWVMLLAKIAALFVVVLVFLAAGAICAIAYQLSRGYTQIEPLLYIQGLSLHAVPFMLTAVVAVVLQVISNRKFLGYLLLILLMMFTNMVFLLLGLMHNLYRYAGAPFTPYSDMNGYGHFLHGWAWFELYWTLFAAMLVVLALAFWVRGTAFDWKSRWREACARLRGSAGVALAALSLLFLATGSWIFYNTNVLNEYIPPDVRMDRQAQYERSYRQYKDLPQPKIVAVRTDVDIFPEQRRVSIRGRYALINQHEVPIGELYLYMNPSAAVVEYGIESASLVLDDKFVGYRIYRLDRPLAPGASFDLDFAVQFVERGFTNTGRAALSGNGRPGEGGMLASLNFNGTYFSNAEALPHVGYFEALQLVDRSERRKRGLGDVPRMAKLEDSAAHMQRQGIQDADWVDFEAVVSTSADQIAIAPGYLQREWLQDGRRYFHYRSDRPMSPRFCYLSARWEVRRGEWRGIPVEIYYDAKHHYNVERMLNAAKKSLDYYAENFSAYQHRQLRIVEYPRYATAAQSFDNTIPYAESIGFMADLRDAQEMDSVLYVVAHEIAHQWWGHQVRGANVQGSLVFSESLAQYSAHMIMEKEYGRERMRRFLKGDLDGYLAARGGELIGELPLMRTEEGTCIAYLKGAMAFYRLRDELGEQALNRALAKMVEDYALRPPPYPTTLDLLDRLRSETPQHKRWLLDELFARVILYDNRATEAKARRLADGRYEVQIAYQAAKNESDSKGAATPLPMDEEVDIGVFGRDPGASEAQERVLYLRKHLIKRGAGNITVIVDSEPHDAGIDPYNKLIDRVSDDNRVRITMDSETPISSI